MKDYAKIANTPRETRSAEKAPVKEKPNLVRSAKELQPKEAAGNKNMFGILLVVFIVIAVGYGVVRQYFATHHVDLSTGKITKEINQIKKNATAATQNAVPQFDFYTVLPKGSQPSSTAAPAAPAPTSSTPTPAATSTPSAAPTTTAPQPAATPSTAQPAAAPAAPVATINVSSAASNKFYLNVGDYTNNDEAQKMLSQLLLLGVQAAVSQKQQNGSTAYEVLVGPFNDQDTMSIVKNQLSSHQINTIVVQ